MEIINVTMRFKKLLESNEIMVVDPGITEHPFFWPCIEGDEYNFESLNLLTQEQKEFLSFFPLTFRVLYNTVNPKNEIVIKDIEVSKEYPNTPLFTLLSLEEIIKRSKNYPNFIDVGLTHMGMGHVNIYSLDNESKKFFVRRDGGSNGYDRCACSQFFCRNCYHPSPESLLKFQELFDSNKLKTVNVETYGNEFKPDFNSKWNHDTGIPYDDYVKKYIS